MLTTVVCRGWNKYLEMQSVYFEEKKCKFCDQIEGKKLWEWEEGLHISLNFSEQEIPGLISKWVRWEFLTGWWNMYNREGGGYWVVGSGYTSYHIRNPKMSWLKAFNLCSPIHQKNLTLAEYYIKLIWNCGLFQFVFYRILTLRF